MKTIANLTQGAIALTMAVLYFSERNRLLIQILIMVTFSISLLLISGGVKRRNQAAEIFELFIYFIGFGLTFIGIENFKEVFDFQANLSPGNFLWVVWLVGLVLNLGEYIVKISTTK